MALWRSLGGVRILLVTLLLGAGAGSLVFADTAIRVSDINPGIGSSGSIFPLIEFGGKLYFAASEPAHGTELYVYDGVNPPSLVVDLYTGTFDSDPRGFTIWNGKLYFSALDAGGVRRIWSYDGVTPPVVATTLPGASEPEQLIAFGSLLAFQATTAASGNELWKWDGVNPPNMVANIRPGSGGALNPNDPFVTFKGLLLFSAYDGGALGQEIYKWDGSNPPTMVGDLVPGFGSSIVDFDQQFEVLNNNLAVFANTDPLGSGQTALWKWDGITPPTTVGTFDLEGGMGLHGGLVYFAALNLDPNNETGRELWSYDGVNPPNRVVPNFGLGITFDFTSFNGFLYFLMGGITADVYKFDGVNPPVNDPDAWPAPGTGPFRGLTPFAGHLYTGASDGVAGRELWKITSVGGGGVTPTVTSIAPTSGPASGGTPVQIGGADFAAGATVRIGAISATNVDVQGPTAIAAVTPALSPGTLNDLAVTNLPALTGILERAFLADFLDMPQADIFHSFVETIFREGITAGCGNGLFCSGGSMTRAQMAVFLLKSKLGVSYLPPACTGTVFGDVLCQGGPYDSWVEDLAARGIAVGCGQGNYCPDAPVTREQMAPLLLKCLLGSGYTPPLCTGTLFVDVPCTGSPFDPWIEDLAGRSVTGGCGTMPARYCPGDPNTRAQMAVFLVKTFGLP